MKNRQGIDLLRYAVHMLSRSNESLNERFTAEELLRIADAVPKTGMDLYPDDWTERQLQECVQLGIIPKWKEETTANGGTKYVPVYRNESEKAIQVAVTWTASQTVTVYADSVSDAIEWAESDMPTPKDGNYMDETFQVDADTTADLNVLTLAKEEYDEQS